MDIYNSTAYVLLQKNFGFHDLGRDPTPNSLIKQP